MIQKASLDPTRSRLQRVLVIDDDPAILQLVDDKLEQSGFEVLTAYSAEEALELISRRGLPHLAIVDIHLPGMDGFDFCRIVQAHTDLPVIMLTAVDEEETVIQGIRHFAEDYVTKPFSPRELAARVERVVRRIADFGHTTTPLLQVDDYLAVDLANKLAVIGGEQVSLTPIETKILYILMRSTGRPVSTEFLLRRLWPLEQVFEDALRVHVHRLRKKIEPNPDRPRYIITKRGQGYLFHKELS